MSNVVFPPMLAVDPEDIATVIEARILAYLLDEEPDRDSHHTSQSQADPEQVPSTHRVPQAVPSSTQALAANRTDSGSMGWRSEATETNRAAPVAESKQPPSGTGRSDSQKHSVELNVARYMKEAQDGRIEAQFSLGCMFMTGPSAKRDVAQAMRWFHLAAQGGHVKAQFNVGVINDRGDGVERDTVKAAYWYRQAAQWGLAEAQFNLGVLYFTGDGVAKSAVEAVNWFRKSAEQGVKSAQNNVGTFYETGFGVELNREKSIQWYRKAALQGLPESQYMLGVKYGLGHGLPSHHIESFRWIRYAANLGHTASQWLAATFYFDGYGVLQDCFEAYRWALVANNSSGDGVNQTCADLLNKIQRTLNSEQKRDCEIIASRWKAKDWDRIKPLRSDPKRIETPEGPQYRIDVVVDAARVLLNRWQIGIEDKARFMGFSPSDQQYFDQLLKGREMLVQGSETEERIGIMYYIRCVLGALFQDKKVENKWLRSPHPVLDGKSPMDLMLTGLRTDLLAARHHVDWVSGRLGC